MKYEDAKAIFLLEHCAERCDGYQKDDACDNCEINAAIEALDKMTELKKYPFCGGEAKIMGVGRDDICKFVYCGECLAETRGCDTEKEAIEAWNRRAE